MTTKKKSKKKKKKTNVQQINDMVKRETDISGYSVV